MKCNKEGKGIRYITSGNLLGGVLRLDLDYKFLDGFNKIEKCRLLPGDLIINCVNSLEQIGKSAVFQEHHGKAIVGFNNYAIELYTEFVLPEYANIVCQSQAFHSQLYFLIKRAVNQVSFAINELDLIAIPIPSLADQRRVVEEVERRLSVAGALEALVERNLLRVKRLRQAILKRAFDGRLVAQDPEDEPAEALLGRIRARREGRPARERRAGPTQMRLPDL